MKSPEAIPLKTTGDLGGVEGQVGDQVDARKREIGGVGGMNLRIPGLTSGPKCVEFRTIDEAIGER